MAPRAALIQYVQETHTKLCVSGKMDVAELRAKVMPSVVESIQRLSSGAPAEVRSQLETFLIENSVLPSFDADKDAFKRALKSIYQFLSILQPTGTPAQNQDAKTTYFDENCNASRPCKSPMSAYFDGDGDLGFNMNLQAAPSATPQLMPALVQGAPLVASFVQASVQNEPTCGEMHIDLQSKQAALHAAEAPAQHQEAQMKNNSALKIKEDSGLRAILSQKEAAPKMQAVQDEQASVESKSTCEETYFDGEVSVETRSTCEEIGAELKHKEEPEAKAPSSTLPNDSSKKEPPSSNMTSSSQSDRSLRGQLLGYIDSTLSRLEANDSMSTLQFRTKVLPSVISSIERLSAAAPTAIKKGIKDIFQKSGVIPVWAADFESLRQALQGIKCLIPGCEGPASTPEIEASLGNPLRGISVAYLSTAFLEQVKALGFDRSAKVYEIEPPVIRAKGKDVICPRDGKPGAAYIDCIAEGDAGMSTHMLSYTWGYEIGDIVDGLLAFCKKNKLDLKRVFVWICCLCINQHRVIEARQRGDVVPFEKFKAEFGHRVSSIGHIVALMSPWKDPSYTKRVWCDFEMYTAASLGEQACKVSVTMPPRESEDMRKTLMTGGAGNHELWEALQNVKIEEAQASVQVDKERILKLIEDTIGFHALNSTVTKCLQSWVAATCQDIFDELFADETRSKEEIAKTAASVGYVLRDVGKNEKALEILTEAEEFFIDAGILDTQDGAVLLSNLGATYRRCGDLETGLKILIQGQQTFERTGTLETLEAAMMYNSLGAAKRKAQDFAGSFDAYEAANAILKNIGKLESSEGAMVLNSYGALKREVGDIDGALQAFEDAEMILENTGKMYSPAGHVLMNSIAAAKKSKNNMQGALQAYEYGHHILERIGTLETEHGMSILINIGLAKKRLRDIQGAHEAYIAARSICQKINATHTPEATKLANLLADLESQMSSKCEGKGHAKGTVAGKFYAGKGCKGKGRSNAGMGQASHQTCGSKGQGKAEKGAQGSTGEFGRAYYGSKGNANTTQGGKGYKGKGKGNSLNVPQ